MHVLLPLSSPPLLHTRSRVPAHTQAYYTCIKGISDTMCNDTVRTEYKVGGRRRAKAQGGFGRGGMESF